MTRSPTGTSTSSRARARCSTRSSSPSSTHPRKATDAVRPPERLAFIAPRRAHLDNVVVEPFGTLVVDFARRVGAKAIVKGLRAISDFEYELEMNQLNRRQAPEIESVYLMARPEFSFVSSSGVKELATFGGRIEDLVPRRGRRRLQEELGDAVTTPRRTGARYP